MKVTVVCPRGETRDTEPELELDGVTIRRYASRFGDGALRGYVREYGSALRQMRRVVDELARDQPLDVVHAGNPPDLLLLAALRQRRRGTAMIFDQHDLVPEQLISQFGDRKLLHQATLTAEKVSYRLADVVVVTNESYRQVALARGKRDDRDVFVVRNAPDLQRFNPVAPDPQLKQGREFLIGFIGIMGPKDGVDDSLYALAALRRRRSDWRAVFAGDGDSLAPMRALSTELGLDDVVEFTGFVSGDRLITVLSSFDVCLAPNPRTPLNEVSTMVKLMEYMAMSKPIAAYDLRETRATAAEAVAYAKGDTPNDLADAISDLLDDPERRARMGEIGRSRIEGALSWKHSERELLRAYDRAFEAAAQRAGK